LQTSTSVYNASGGDCHARSGDSEEIREYRGVRRLAGRQLSAQIAMIAVGRNAFMAR
jgi:hypothetical protein